MTACATACALAGPVLAPELAMALAAALALPLPRALATAVALAEAPPGATVATGTGGGGEGGGGDGGGGDGAVTWPKPLQHPSHAHKYQCCNVAMLLSHDHDPRGVQTKAPCEHACCQDSNANMRAEYSYDVYTLYQYIYICTAWK